MKRSVLGLAAMMCVALPAIAATPPQQSDEDDNAIVVTAVPRDPVELRKKVGSFVGRVAQIATQGQLSRRTSAFCPKVLGMEDRYRPMVLAKVREAAAAAGLKEQPEGCKTDLTIIFTTDGDRLLNALRTKRPGIFAQQAPAKNRELFGSGRAVRWWYSNAPKDQNGADMGDAQAMNVGNSADGMNSINVYSSSLITTNVVVNLSSNVVVIDVAKAEGYPLDAVASYAAMVSFAQVTGARDDTLAQAPSVLGMFARPGPRKEALRDLTAWDRAYLHGLYKIEPNRPFSTQRRRLTNEMRDAIVAE